MRAVRVKRLRAIFKELVSRHLVPNGKSNWMFFKKMYKNGELEKFLPSM